MDAGHDGLTLPPDPPARASDRPAAASPASTVPAVAGRRLQAVLDDIRAHWDTAYHVAAARLDDGETWNAARLDGSAHFSAADPASLTGMLRRDDVPPPRQVRTADRLLERLRARNPGWAIVLCGDGVLAVRAGKVLGPESQDVVSNLLEQERHEDARRMGRALAHPATATKT